MNNFWTEQLHSSDRAAEGRRKEVHHPAFVFPAAGVRGTYSLQQLHEPKGTVALLLVTGTVSAADLIMGGALTGYEPPGRRRHWEPRGAAFLLVAFAFAALYPPGASAVFLPVHPAWARALAAGYQVHHLAYRIADPEFRWVYTEEPERIMDPGARLVIQRDRRMQLLAYWRWEPALGYHPDAVLHFRGVWYHDGAEVEEFSGMVDAPDPPSDLIYLRSASPVGVGLELAGTREVVVTTDSLVISRMRVDIEGTDPPQGTR